MKTVKVELGERSYNVLTGAGAIARAGALASEVCRGRTAVVVSNPVVAGLHADALIRSLEDAGFTARMITVPAGEEHKTLSTVADIYASLVDLKIDRLGVIFTLGGGVVGDMAGFAAATYLRGIDFIQVPTTLLAQVDASVGGKTGVDLPQGKNLVGAFYQPRAVICDTDTLKTLPGRELRAGLAEVVKHGIITDLPYFEFLEDNTMGLLGLDPSVMEHAIARSIEIKADVVSKDERETTDLRKKLNLGHTFAHGLETAGGYSQYLHGEAVAIGMVAAAHLAEELGIARDGTSERIAALLKSLELPVAPLDGTDISEVQQAMRLDKKVARGKVNFVLPRFIGEVVVTDNVPESAVLDVLGRWAS